MLIMTTSSGDDYSWNISDDNQVELNGRLSEQMCSRILYLTFMIKQTNVSNEDD